MHNYYASQIYCVKHKLLYSTDFYVVTHLIKKRAELYPPYKIRNNKRFVVITHYELRITN